MGLLVLGTSIILLLVAALAILMLIRPFKQKIPWILIASSLAFMLLTQLATVYRAASSEAEQIIDFQAALLSLAISSLMLAGILLARPLIRGALESASRINLTEKKFKRFFDSSQVSIWDENFSEIYESFRLLRKSGITDLREYLSENKNAASKMASTVTINGVNNATLKLFKADSEAHFIDSIDQVFGKDATDVFTDELCAIWDKERTFQAEAKHTTLDGKELAVIISMPVPVTEDEFLSVPVSIVDITEQKQWDQQRMQRIESIGVLAGGIAHDFNNILTGLFGNISLARDELSDDHPAARFLQRSQDAMDRAISAIRQLHTFTKGGHPVKETVDIKTLVEDIVQFDLSGSNVMFHIDQADTELTVDVDRGQIQQVISNVTINAMQAMQDGGHLYVKLELCDSSDSGAPNLDSGNHVKISFRDEGSGIAPNDRDRIFEPYFSTKQTGHGLGLATSYSIITKHGGHISVDSELGKGSVFTIYLPAKTASPERCADLARSEARVSSADRPLRVLLMDDDELVRDVATRMLQKGGCEVETAADGRQALEMYKMSLLSKRRFDCVVLDLRIPGGQGGKDAIKDILEIDPDAAVIVSSGSSDDEIMVNYSEFGFKAIAAKPYRASQLLDAVHESLRC